MNLNNFIKKYNKIPLSKKIQLIIENYLIKNKLKNIKILEFGVDKGISTSLFLKYCQKNNSKLFSVDIIDYSKLFKNKNWKFLKCRDDEYNKINKFIKWPADVIFLDTEHTAKHVEKILYLYFNKLKLNGFFLIDDISWLPYCKNQYRDHSWVEINNRETFLTLLEIYNSNKDKIEISFNFEESGFCKIKKLKHASLNHKKKIIFRKYFMRSILKFFNLK